MTINDLQKALETLPVLHRHLHTCTHIHMYIHVHVHTLTCTHTAGERSNKSTCDRSDSTVMSYYHRGANEAVHGSVLCRYKSL